MQDLEKLVAGALFFSLAALGETAQYYLKQATGHAPKFVRGRVEEVEKTIVGKTDQIEQMTRLASKLNFKDLGDNRGAGTAIELSGGIGGRGYLRAMRFGNRTHFYCGVGIGIESDVEASGKVFKTHAESCNGNNYAGGTLSFALNGTLPGIEIGLSKQINVVLGNNKDKFFDAMADLRKKSDGYSTKTATRLFTAARESYDKRSPKPLQKAQFAIGMGVLNALSSVKDVAIDAFEKDTAQALIFGITGKGDLPDATKGIADLRDAMRAVAKENDDADIREMAGAYADALSVMHETLSGCSFIDDGAKMGVGAVPISANLGYSVTSKLGSAPDDIFTPAVTPLEVTKKATRLATDSELRDLATKTMEIIGPDATSGKRASYKYCLAPAVKDLCGVYEKISPQGLKNIEGVVPRLLCK